MDCKSNIVADYIDEAGMALEKGLLILGDLTTAFPFDGDRDEYIQAWTFECERITTFIDIVHDYMSGAYKNLSRAKEIQKGGVAQ